jgi:lysophospholipase L1-like esterase
LNASIRAMGDESNTDRVFTADVTDRLFNQQAMNASDYWDRTHLESSGGTKFANALYPEVAARVRQARRC